MHKYRVTEIYQSSETPINHVITWLYLYGAYHLGKDLYSENLIFETISIG